MASLLVLYNPVCGGSGAQRLFAEQVLPLLNQHGRIPDAVVITTHAGHAGEVVVDFIHKKPGPLTIILGSGDGTLHEIVVALSNATFPEPTEISVVLVPCGTANALYWSIFPPNASQSETSVFKSLETFLSVPSAPRLLTFGVTSFPSQTSSAGQPDTVKTSVAIVVASTSLHASILHDSEALRTSHPGIERFKIAAQQNITRWYNAHVKLYPSSGSKAVEIYNPKVKRFEPIAQTEGEILLSGPFAYFLSTVNVDRLESAFRITPLHAPGTADASLDVVMIRPRRDKTIADDGEPSRQVFAKRIQDVLMGAYQNGAHIDIMYDQEGGAQREDEAHSVLEYFRCGRWEWVPVSTFVPSQWARADGIHKEPGDDGAHLVCVDGEVIELAPAGRAECSATTTISNIHISVVA